MRHQRGLGPGDPLPTYDDGRLVVRPADYIATGDGVILRLKLRELGLLAQLASDPGRVVCRDELLDTVWMDDREVTPRAVDAAVARLRASLVVALPDVRYVHTHARMGYRFWPEPVASQKADVGDSTAADSGSEISASAIGGADPSASRVSASNR